MVRRKKVTPESVPDEPALPVRAGFKTNLRKIQHGAWTLTRAYWRGALDKRKLPGRALAEWEQEYAAHCGFDSFDDCPVTLRDVIKVIISNRLFLATYLPGPEVGVAAFNHIKAAENTIAKLSASLGLKRTEKPVQDLHDFLKENFE